MPKNNSTGRRPEFIRILVMAGLLIFVIALSTMLSSGEGNAESDSQSAPLIAETSIVKAQSSGYFEAIGPIARMLGALIVVVLCIYFGLYMLKRLTVRKQMMPQANGSLQVIQTAYLSPKRSVSIVKVARRSVLIGVTESQLSVLTELSEEETAELMQSADVKIEEDGFSRILGQAIGKLKMMRPRRTAAITGTQ